MQRHPAIAQVMAEERELIVDTAELKLHEAVGRAEPWAVCFTLKCLRKARGCIERQERTGAGRQSLVPDGKPLVVISGNKEEYISELRKLRGAVQSTPTGVRPVPLQGDGHGHNGDSPG